MKYVAVVDSYPSDLVGKKTEKTRVKNSVFID
jgi:hypothetical protein